jgi:predicted lipoprotein with Yx(FWY)xxD motif
VTQRRETAGRWSAVIPRSARLAVGGVVSAVALIVGMVCLPAIGRAPVASAGVEDSMTSSATTTPTTTPSGVEISTRTTPFGTALVVGSGPFKGYSLYFITSDHGDTFGCTGTPVKTPVGKMLCAGPSNDNAAEWPAITTTGSPVAGTGVTQSLLGTVTRSFGVQVTYAGHPLYLFDPAVGQLTGEDYDEPDLPPWHGIWYLMSPTGKALPWAGSLTTTSIGGKKVLAAQMLTLDGWVNFPVYSFSNDSPTHSACTTGSCARFWPALLTSGTPAISGGVTASEVSTLHTPAGTMVSYDNQPLYFYAYEDVVVSGGVYKPQGNGAGLVTDGGVWNLVTP